MDCTLFVFSYIFISFSVTSAVFISGSLKGGFPREPASFVGARRAQANRINNNKQRGLYAKPLASLRPIRRASFDLFVCAEQLPPAARIAPDRQRRKQLGWPTKALPDRLSQISVSADLSLTNLLALGTLSGC